MPDIAVYGSLSELSAKLNRIKEVIANRNAVGYPPKQHEYEYQYHTVQDLNVCGDCAPLNGSIYRGDYILGDFPYYVDINQIEIMVHNATSYHAAEKCRCKLTWTNKHEALVTMLYNELTEAVDWMDARSFTVVKRVGA